MLNKIEFSDLYKFITSTGLIIIGFAFLIPWLFLKQEQGLSISEKEYKLLNENARSLLDNKIELNLLISKSLLIISLVFFVFGILAMAYGIRKWFKKQKLLDEIQHIEVAEKRAKQKTLAKHEVVQKADLEISEEIDSIQANQNSQQKISLDSREEMKSNLIDLEQSFYKKLLDYNPHQYRISNNIKIADKYEIDLLLNSYNTAKFDDILIEIKYLQNSLNLELIRKSFNQFKLTFSNYTTSTKRNGKMVYIVVYKKNIASEVEVEKFKNDFNKFIDTEQNSRISFILLSNNDLTNFDVRNLLD